MEKKLYKHMNWPEIEAIIYSEHNHPRNILGKKSLGSNTLFQVFRPDAKEIYFLDADGTKHSFEKMEDGYFAILSHGKRTEMFHYMFQDSNGTVQVKLDPYSFPVQLSEKQTQDITKGRSYTLYQYLGAMEHSINSVNGILFRVYAPNAIRVSVALEEEMFDGRIYPMENLYDSGIYEIFIPGLKDSFGYAFEIKLKGNIVYLKRDPFNRFLKETKTAGLVSLFKKDTVFQWTDAAYIQDKSKKDILKQPVSIYQISFDSLIHKDLSYQENLEKLDEFIDYISNMGYSHIQLLPLYPNTHSHNLRYHTTDFYALPDSEYSDYIKYLVNTCHRNKIGVIQELVLSCFSKDDRGLSFFDGTPLFEYLDVRNRFHGTNQNVLFDYSKAFVRAYKISELAYYLDKYHMDGIFLSDLASILYLNYGKNEFEFAPNKHGGVENLFGIEFLKELNTFIRQRNKSCFTIADENSCWPEVTGASLDSLGFFFKWNNNLIEEFLKYFTCETGKNNYYENLSTPMLYNYCEAYINPVSHFFVATNGPALLAEFPGSIIEKLNLYKLFFGYLYTYPGKKLLFSGLDQATMDAFHFHRKFSKHLLDYEENQKINLYFKDLNHLYSDHSTLKDTDYNAESFGWLEFRSNKEGILIFYRTSQKKEQKIMVVLHNGENSFEKLEIGVPWKGYYKEIFNSDQEKYGGEGIVNFRKRKSKAQMKNSFKNCIDVHIAKTAILIFEYQKDTVTDGKKKSKKDSSLKNKLFDSFLESENAMV